MTMMMITTGMRMMIPIEVTLSGIVTDVSPEHDWKALYARYTVKVLALILMIIVVLVIIPIEVIVVGIVIEVSPVHP